MTSKYSELKKELRKFVTQLNRAQEYIYRLKYRDSLTQLPNRRKLIDTFNDTLSGKTNTEKALYLIDIDRFHAINELYGREVGDQVLVEFAKRLYGLFNTDNTVFRSGEDEFYIYLENTSHQSLSRIGNKILETINKPFEIEGRVFYITASIGISHYPTTATNITKLLHQAEIAMFNVKNNGKNDYRIIKRDDTIDIERKRRIEFALNEAVLNKELYLVYQPQVYLKTGEIFSAEALLRWEHPELGFISPAEFIPIAEDSGIINEIGEWVIEEAVRQVKEWHNIGLEIAVAVNISPVQFYDKYLARKITEVINSYELDPSYFIVEITESVMKDLQDAEMIAKELHNNHVKVAIDDFGMGYSSLSVLSNRYIDLVKIDRAFINGIPEDEHNVALVKTMIQMSTTLGFNILAEGIERPEQSEFLVENDCVIGQGFFFSRPVAPVEIVNYANNFSSSL